MSKDKRKHNRKEFKAREGRPIASLQIHSLFSMPQKALVRDVSRGGIGVLSKKKVKVGDAIQVFFGKTKNCFVGKVKFAAPIRYKGTNYYSYGVEFEAPLNITQMNYLGIDEEDE